MGKRGDIIDHSSEDDLTPSEELPWLQERLEWFQDQKFGLFMHWGIYSVWGITESWPLSPADEWARPETMKPWVERDRDLARFSAESRALNKQFDPQAFDPAAWADAARDAGMRYVCFTTKHHDGFCMFDTRTTDYRVTHPSCPFHRDPRANITRDVFDAFREKDMGIWCYFSKSDWHTPGYWCPDYPIVDRNPNYDTHREPERWESFVQYTHAQLRELLSDYGKVDVLWLDGGQVRPPDQDIRMDEIAAFGRQLQPGLIIADRTVGGKHENFITPEQTVPDKPLGCPWESCVTMGKAFSFSFNDTFKSTRELIHLLIDIVSKGGNLLLNVAPSPTGCLPAEALERLADIGDWMDVNSEGIHGTRAIAPYAEKDIRFTTRDGVVYAFILSAEEAPGPTITLDSLQPRDGEPVVLLGESEPLSWQRSEDRTVVQLPEQLPTDHACCLRFRR